MSLQRIYLKDFVIVHSLDLDFHAGFTALTGETGAGKSILIDALQLALGGRAEASMIREGQLRAEVTVDFSTTPQVNDWLNEQSIDQENNAVLVRRTVDNQGRSRGWINGAAVTATQLRELGGMLLDIHGQHAWQGLMKPESTRTLLDKYGGIDTQRLPQLWADWKQAQTAVTQVIAGQAQMESEHDQIQWQLAELEKLNPGAAEWDSLQAEHSRLANVSALMEAAKTTIEHLSAGHSNAMGMLAKAVNALKQRSDVEHQFKEWSQSLDDALLLVQDTNRELHGYMRRTEAHPERLQELDQRMGTWMSLAKRHHCAPVDLPQLVTEYKKKLVRLKEKSDLTHLNGAENAARKAYSDAAKFISLQRHECAPGLAAAITAVMQRLGMEGGVFEAQLVPHEEPTSHGLENIEFLVSGHADTQPKPVMKVASGGELSRIALAIAVTTSQLGGSPTLIFDEVDSGVGGSVASTVGTLMRELGKSRQVLAVTHLAQVASCANHHLKVEKSVTETGVQSTVSALTQAERVQEIARMLGGATITEASVAHAKEMLST